MDEQRRKRRRDRQAIRAARKSARLTGRRQARRATAELWPTEVESERLVRLTTPGGTVFDACVLFRPHMPALVMANFGSVAQQDPAGPSQVRSQGPTPRDQELPPVEVGDTVVLASDVAFTASSGVYAVASGRHFVDVEVPTRHPLRGTSFRTEPIEVTSIIALRRDESA